MKKKAPSNLVQEESFFRRLDKKRKKTILKYLDKRFLQAVLCGLIILGFVFLVKISLMQRFELVVLDYLFRHRPAPTVHEDIVYIEVSEDSLRAFGRWPWERKHHAVMTHILTEWGADSILFDIYFVEESDEFDDGAFSQAIEASKRVYLPVLVQRERIEGVMHKSWMRSIPIFEDHAVGLGHINIIPDRDGTLRNIKPEITLDGLTYKHIAIELAEDYLSRRGQSVNFLQEMPIDEDGNVLINWAGRWERTFEHYSFFEVVQSYAASKKGEKGLVSPEDIKDKICIVGLTAAGLPDIKATPLQEAYPGIGVIANFLNSMLTQQFVKAAPEAWNYAALICVGVIAASIFFLFTGLRALLFGIFLAISWVFLVITVFVLTGVWFQVVVALFLVMALYIFCSIYTVVLAQVDRNKMFELATRDGLTGLYVIRHFRFLLNHAAEAARKKQFPISVILLDIDHFKQINDTHGHDAGDYILKGLAHVLDMAALEKQVDPHKITVARYGGEEFILMFEHCNLMDAAFRYGEHIRKRIEQNRFVYEGTHIPVTISLGVSEYKFDENVPDLMVRRADAGLYRAKESGRNQVCIQKENAVNKKN